MPPRAANRTSRRAPLNLRTTDDLRTKLEAAAEAAGRNLTQEVERRIELSFEYEERFGELRAYMAEQKLKIDEANAGNLKAALHRAQWQNKVTPYGRVWLEPHEGTPASQSEWRYPDEIKPSDKTPASEPMRPVATVDLRSLIEETVKRTLAEVPREASTQGPIPSRQSRRSKAAKPVPFYVRRRARSDTTQH